MLHLSICHTVIIQEIEDEIQYNASSPDELALVNAARYFGFFFKGWDFDNNIEIEYKDVCNFSSEPILMRFELLNVIEFTSTWKWMTVVVKTPDGIIKVLTKGADSIIQARL